MELYKSVDVITEPQNKKLPQIGDLVRNVCGVFVGNVTSSFINDGWQPLTMYIVDDGSIRENDWVYIPTSKTIKTIPTIVQVGKKFPIDDRFYSKDRSFILHKNYVAYKRILATNDSTLNTLKNIPTISKEFIEEWADCQGDCRVMVARAFPSYGDYYADLPKLSGTDIVLRIEPKKVAEVNEVADSFFKEVLRAGNDFAESIQGHISGDEKACVRLGFEKGVEWYRQNKEINWLEIDKSNMPVGIVLAINIDNRDNINIGRLIRHGRIKVVCQDYTGEEFMCTHYLPEQTLINLLNKNTPTT